MNIRMMSKAEVMEQLAADIEKEKRYIQVAPKRCVEEGKRKIIDFELELRRLRGCINQNQ